MLLFGGSAITWLALTPNLVWAAPSAGAIASSRLRAFLTQTVGQPTEQRLARAKAALSRINRLTEDTLLVEIAAIGMLVRVSSTREALRQGYPERSREALALAQDRLAGEGWTQALHGAWHYEVAARSTMAALYYGASRGEGASSFELARRLSPQDAGIPLAEAIALLGDRPERNASKALAALQSSPPMKLSPYTALVGAHRNRLIALLKAAQAMDAANHAKAIF